jgi:hypothetical protein
MSAIRLVGDARWKKAIEAFGRLEEHVENLFMACGKFSCSIFKTFFNLL